MMMKATKATTRKNTLASITRSKVALPEGLRGVALRAMMGLSNHNDILAETEVDVREIAERAAETVFHQGKVATYLSLSSTTTTEWREAQPRRTERASSCFAHRAVCHASLA